jgi:hypothetical protein
MGHAGVGLIAAALAQAARPGPEALADRWLVLGRTHDTRAAAEAQAAGIRERHYPDVQVIATDHYANMIPGRFVVVFWALPDKAEALRRQSGVWNLGHRSWIRWSGAYVPHPTPRSLRQRRKRLSAPRPGRASSASGDQPARRSFGRNPSSG